jgi:hypothetical protein
VLDPAVHVRAKTDQKRVEQYSIAYVAGDPLPAVDVFFDGTAYYVANGYHRVPARKKAGFDEILCNIRKGGKREAILFALGQDRNLPRSNADKVKAATQLLNDPEWRAWSDAVIGRLCDVTPQFIGKLGKKLGVRKTIRKTKAGRTINVSKMGAKGKHPADPAKKPDAKPQPGATRNGFGSVGNSGTGSLATPTDLETAQTNVANEHEIGGVAALALVTHPGTPLATGSNAMAETNGSAGVELDLPENGSGRDWIPADAPMPVITITDRAPVAHTSMILAAVTALDEEERQGIAIAAFESLDHDHQAHVLAEIGAQWATVVASENDEPMDETNDDEGIANDEAGSATNANDSADDKPGLRKTQVSKEDLDDLRARVNEAIASGATTVKNVVDGCGFTDRQHLNKFRHGRGVAAEKVEALIAFLDARVGKKSA